MRSKIAGLPELVLLPVFHPLVECLCGVRDHVSVVQSQVNVVCALMEREGTEEHHIILQKNIIICFPQYIRMIFILIGSREALELYNNFVFKPPLHVNQVTSPRGLDI